MVVACLIKQIQITCELQKMGDIGLLPRETVASIINSKFEDPVSTSTEEEDPLVKGEFEVIKELLEKLPGAVEGKKMVDRVIDICGPAPRGSGLQNLRECIIETKWKYDVAPEDRQGNYHILLSYHRVVTVVHNSDNRFSGIQADDSELHGEIFLSHLLLCLRQ